jgi:hypothetical protein
MHDLLSVKSKCAISECCFLLRFLSVCLSGLGTRVPLPECEVWGSRGMTTEVTVFRDLMLCSLVDMSRRFGRTCCLHQKGQFRGRSLAGFSELSVHVYRITRCHIFVTVHNVYSTVHNGVPPGKFLEANIFEYLVINDFFIHRTRETETLNIGVYCGLQQTIL